jgi:solute carrier family 25 (mitochondrial carnitine/acylcarnitine transporter), member 20/29
MGNSFISTPVEHMRIRMQNQNVGGVSNYTGSFNAFSRIYKQFGIVGIYQGFGATMLRDVIAFAIFFGMYEHLKQRTTDPMGPKNLSVLMSCGAAAGVTLWIATYPIDSIKTRIQ